LARKTLVLVVAAFLAFAPLARADGDPASDYLLTRATFVPPDLGISGGDAARLATVVQSAHAGGYTIRVALIGSRYDLGSVSSLFGKPKLYARFLGKELTLVYHGRLLVVMPSGYGVSRAGTLLPAGQATVDRLQPPGPSPANLLASAIDAVRRLAGSSGVTVQAPPPASSGGSSSPWVWGVVGVLLASALALGGWLGLRRRRA
jgi:hypothetical protein